MREMPAPAINAWGKVRPISAIGKAVAAVEMVDIFMKLSEVHLIPELFNAFLKSL